MIRKASCPAEAICRAFDLRTSIEVIKQDILESNSSILIVVDVIYPKISEMLSETQKKTTVVVSPFDSLPFMLKWGARLKGRIAKHSASTVEWNHFTKKHGSMSILPPMNLKQGS